MEIDLNKLKPYPGKILGKIDQSDYTTAGGIFVVDSIKRKKPRRVKVVSVGGKFSVKGEQGYYFAEKGQIAYFKTAEGEPITINRENYLMLDNDDIIATETNTLLEAAGEYTILRPIVEKMRGSIYIPEKNQETLSSPRGFLISLGPDNPYRHFLKEGTIIIYRKNEGVPIESQFSKFLALKKEWILGYEEEL